MSIKRRSALTAGLAGILSAATWSASRADTGFQVGIVDGLEDFWLATDAYVFGYPLVTMEMTRRIMTNVAAPVGTRGPMGQFVKARHYPMPLPVLVRAGTNELLFQAGRGDLRAKLIPPPGPLAIHTADCTLPKSTICSALK